ncbi:hypothetical protein TIFTF001_008932 [Ficus carica]|uniref:Uncharacterized protein n=1 Tax=Ficus carica TaxID=3494 RepID=A0AA87ZUD6_FICCA|nr:hypothetical protein TIFTF001_008932 [Ficus carica]
MTIRKFSRVVPTYHKGEFGPWFELDWTGHPNHSMNARHGKQSTGKYGNGLSKAGRYSDIEAQNDIYAPTIAVTTIGGVVEFDSSRSGGEDEKSEGGGKNNGDIGDIINGGGDFEVEDVTNALPNVCFETEINVERDMEDSHFNKFFYQTLTCSSDEDCEKDVLDVKQPRRRPQRHLNKSKYMRTSYTDPDPKKMIFCKGKNSINYAYRTVGENHLKTIRIQIRNPHLFLVSG